MPIKRRIKFNTVISITFEFTTFSRRNSAFAISLILHDRKIFL